MDQDRAVARGTEVSTLSQPSGKIYENNRAVQCCQLLAEFPGHAAGEKMGPLGKIFG
jgi:hypothetical protein